MMPLYPQDCPVFEFKGAGHWGGTHVQLLEVEKDRLGWIGLWHTCKASFPHCHVGYLFDVDGLRPLTAAAREQLEHIRAAR